MTGYVYDQGWKEERQRLAGMEALWDPGSRRLLEQLGLDPGARVLEVGGGGGALAEWICGPVGAKGSVVATDLDTRFLDAIEHDALEVLTHDIAADPLPAPGFDVIHPAWCSSTCRARGRPGQARHGARPGGLAADRGLRLEKLRLHPTAGGRGRGRRPVSASWRPDGYERMFGCGSPDMLRDAACRTFDGEGRSLVLDADHRGRVLPPHRWSSSGPCSSSRARLKADRGRTGRPSADEPGRIARTRRRWWQASDAPPGASRAHCYPFQAAARSSERPS